jgi:hypothetical protein
MARKFLTPVNLPTGSANPTIGSLGDLFYRTDLKTVVSYDGTQWISPGITSEDVLNILIEFGILNGDGGSVSSGIDGGSPSTTEFSLSAYTANVDGGSPSTTEFVLSYAGEEF